MNPARAIWRPRSMGLHDLPARPHAAEDAGVASGHEPRAVVAALIVGGVSTAAALARFGALGVPDRISHRQAALLGVIIAAVVVGLTGMIVLARRVRRAARAGFRLTRRQLAAAVVGRPLVAVGGVVLAQRLLPWWRHELASGQWRHSHAHAGLLRWAPTEVVAVTALPMAYLLALLSSSTWEARARRQPLSVAAVTNGGGVRRRYHASWWVCPTCGRAFSTESNCRGTSVWAHDEIAAAATADQWNAFDGPPRSRFSKPYDA